VGLLHPNLNLSPRPSSIVSESGGSGAGSRAGGTIIIDRRIIAGDDDVASWRLSEGAAASRDRGGRDDG
jgi:hypothetical protein